MVTNNTRVGKIEDLFKGIGKMVVCVDECDRDRDSDLTLGLI